MGILSPTDTYIQIFTEPLKECLKYKPKFGHANKHDGYDLDAFLTLYESDPFYSWIGLASPHMYMAHKASGCMTSIYRQLGIGCERLFRQILVDTCMYDSYEDSQWSYETTTKAGKSKTLYLDGRIEIDAIRNPAIKGNVRNWIKQFGSSMNIDDRDYKGIVFEVRQGYKSKDSKRQNGDLDNATVAYAYHYVPVFAIFSSQIDNDIVLRYRNSRCGILTGIMSNNSQCSLFAFCKEVLQYDLAAFFKENSSRIKAEMQSVLTTLFDVK